MNLVTARYAELETKWPQTGCHILAQFDQESVVVYQAFCPDIGRFAAANGYFGGSFGHNRMSWIKPNVLWMMYRSGWGSKDGQEVVLAVRLRRSAFNEILAQAVHSAFVPALYASADDWKNQVRQSNVRLQWDPDHDPTGVPLRRRAIQLGLRGDTLARYGKEWVLDIEDITAFVHEQRGYIEGESRKSLIVPHEDVYQVDDPQVAVKLGIGRES